MPKSQCEKLTHEAYLRKLTCFNFLVSSVTVIGAKGASAKVHNIFVNERFQLQNHLCYYVCTWGLRWLVCDNTAQSYTQYPQKCARKFNIKILAIAIAILFIFTRLHSVVSLRGCVSFQEHPDHIDWSSWDYTCWCGTRKVFTCTNQI